MDTNDQAPHGPEHATGTPALPEADGAPAGGNRPSRKSAWLAMGAVALALALIWLAPGIGDDSGSSAPGSEATGDYPGEPEDAQASGKAAPLHFTVKDMHGVDVKLASFKGKVILLNFWATWCGPCKAEIPSLVELQAQYKDDLVILGFSVDDTVEKMKPYARRQRARGRAGCVRPDVRHPGLGDHRPRGADREEALGHRVEGPVRTGDQGPVVVEGL
jgi:thiol-disulfide isomerase/thioredoxin